MSNTQTTITDGWNRRSKAILRELRSHLETVADIQLNPMQLNEAASLIAGLCLTLSKELETRGERRQSHQLSQLMNDDLGQLFSTLLTDRVPRLSDGTDVTKQARRVLLCRLDAGRQQVSHLQLEPTLEHRIAHHLGKCSHGRECRVRGS